MVFTDRDAHDGVDMNQWIVFRLEPQEEIEICKKDGDKTERVVIPVRDRAGVRQYTEEYKALFMSASAGDRSIFLSPKETLLLWRFAESVVNGWKAGATPLEIYKKNTTPNFR